MRLTKDAQPTLSTGAHAFTDQVENGEYWGVPTDYFEVRGDTVYLDSDLAAQLEWTVDEDLGEKLNIAAVAQTVQVDGQTLQINPGFFCSYVATENVQKRG